MCSATPPKKAKYVNHDGKSNKIFIQCDHDYLATCNGCFEKNAEIKDLKQKIRKLESQLKLAQTSLKPKSKCSYVFKSDKSVKFYNRIPSVGSFNAIYKVLEPKIKKLKYWKGPTHHILTCKKFKQSGPKRGLTAKQEMVMTLMKLRLGLLNQDLADRFEISTAQVSRIFTTWIKILDKFLGSLVFNPSKEVVLENLPPSFQTPNYSSVQHIVDCTEVFLEKPQNLEVQAKTWSNYKNHHTGKFLVSITPSGLINFVSESWGGSTSDKYFASNSGFYDILEPFDTVMADRGFQIAEELTLHQAYLLVPPGRRGASQMSAHEVRKTKQIANRRIYVEQAIRRMKCFRVLKFELPITLIQHLDNIVKVIAGICNLYPPCPNTSEENNEQFLKYRYFVVLSMLYYF